MAKIQFTSKSSKGFRTISNNVHKGFNACVRDVLQVWDKKNLNDDEKAVVDALRTACKEDGVNRSDFTAEYIIKHLDGTNYCKDGVLGVTKKGEFTPKVSWTPGQVIDYVRRASRAHFLALAKENK